MPLILRSLVLLVIGEELTHWSAIGRTLYHSFGMLSPERLGNVTTPPNGEMRFKKLRQFLGNNFAPLHCLSVGADQRRPVVVPMQLKKGLVAVCASPASVPVGDFRPQQTVLRVRSELAQAFLATVLALWPAGTFAQMDFRTSCQRTSGRVTGRRSHTSCFASFGAGEQHLASIPEQHACSIREPNGHGGQENRKGNHDEEINGRCHTQLFGSYCISTTIGTSRK